jgi:hypothetical protein
MKSDDAVSLSASAPSASSTRVSKEVMVLRRTRTDSLLFRCTESRKSASCDTCTGCSEKGSSSVGVAAASSSTATAFLATGGGRGDRPGLFGIPPRGTVGELGAVNTDVNGPLRAEASRTRCESLAARLRGERSAGTSGDGASGNVTALRAIAFDSERCLVSVPSSRGSSASVGTPDLIPLRAAKKLSVRRGERTPPSAGVSPTGTGPLAHDRGALVAGAILSVDGEVLPSTSTLGGSLGCASTCG